MNDFLTGGEASAALGSAGFEKDDEVTRAANLLIGKLNEGELGEAVTKRLLDAIPAEFLPAAAMIDVDFDMREELAQQRMLVSALRTKVMSAGGTLKAGVSISEVKSVTDTCRQFSELIRKNMESIVNLERIQAIEAAVLETVSGHGEDFKREFLTDLEKQLEIFCKEE